MAEFSNQKPRNVGARPDAGPSTALRGVAGIVLLPLNFFLHSNKHMPYIELSAIADLRRLIIFSVPTPMQTLIQVALDGMTLFSTVSF